jgi:hypothetical protein
MDLCQQEQATTTIMVKARTQHATAYKLYLYLATVANRAKAGASLTEVQAITCPAS